MATDEHPHPMRNIRYQSRVRLPRCSTQSRASCSDGSSWPRARSRGSQSTLREPKIWFSRNTSKNSWNPPWSLFKAFWIIGVRSWRLKIRFISPRIVSLSIVEQIFRQKCSNQKSWVAAFWLRCTSPTPESQRRRFRVWSGGGSVFEFPPETQQTYLMFISLLKIEFVVIGWGRGETKWSGGKGEEWGEKRGWGGRVGGCWSWRVQFDVI